MIGPLNLIAICPFYCDTASELSSTLHEHSTDPANWVIAGVTCLTLIVSLIALFKDSFRKGQITINVAEFMYVTHIIGNPNIYTWMALRNIGGRPVYIKDVHLRIYQGGEEKATMPAATAMWSEGSNRTRPFMPFTLKAWEDWGYEVSFWRLFDPDVNTQYRKDCDSLIAEFSFINPSFEVRPDGIHRKTPTNQVPEPVLAPVPEPVPEDFAALTSLYRLFNTKFIWKVGAYQLDICVVYTEGLFGQTEKTSKSSYNFDIMPDTHDLLVNIKEQYRHARYTQSGAHANVPRIWVPLNRQ